MAASNQDGFVLIEILVSALVLAIAAAGVFTLLSSTTRSAAQARNRTQAYAVAEEDQTRLRSMRLSELNGLNQETTVPVNGTPYKVISKGAFVNAKSTTTSCTEPKASADYVRVSSSVTWPTMGSQSAVLIGSIISPSNGSLDPQHGGLTVTVTNAAEVPIPGVRIEGTGPGAFVGTTDSTGCVIFADLPEGNYTVTPSGVAAGLIDKDGKAPGSVTIGVVKETTTPLGLRYDQPGAIREVVFETRNAEGTPIRSSVDSIVVANAGMTTAKVFGSPGGTRNTAIGGSSLFPFTTPDTVYAGSCSGDNPNPSGEANPPGAAAMGSVLVPAGGTYSTPVVLRLPALYLTVKSGASLVSGATVTVSDDNCTVAGKAVKREYTTTPQGRLASPLDPERKIEDPGLPWSTYDICAWAKISGSNRRITVTKVPVQNLTTGTNLTLDLSGTGSELGKCP